MESHPFAKLRKELNVDGKTYTYFSLPDLKDARLGNPFHLLLIP